MYCVPVDPGAGDRGGHDDDGVNYTQLLADLRAKYTGVISFTAPTSYWYLRHFDLEAMTDHVNWINVMSYDLHGTWDSSDPIGNQVLGHTNLTEIKLALDLYWRNSISPDKINLGLGFYGRSFQLTDPGCYTPGCLFKGGANPGPCTANSGTLSYREIMDVIADNTLTPYYDKVAQIKYITWDSDQWVSYDDQDTFQAKIKYANEQGLGGLLVWALDQDTLQLDALSAVIYPKALGSIGAEAEGVNNWETLGASDCRVTACGTTGCSTGEVHMTDQRCDGKGQESSLCCPFAAAPDPSTCTWRGTAPLCNGQCHPGEVALESNSWGSGDHCDDGLKFYCCPATREVPDCRWTDCGDTCDSSTENKLTWAEENCWFGDTQEFCCSKEQEWDNCAWYGKGGSCFDDHCPTGHSVSLTTSYEGEGTDCGWRLERQRSFCCDPAAGESAFLPVPLADLFPSPPTGDDVASDYKLKVDPTYGGSAPLSFADDPNDAEFGFVVLASPEPLQVSLDKRDGSHWDVFDCFEAKSEEAQTVRMMCTDSSASSNCAKIHLGHGAVGTIVEMPKGCGPGRYAVVKDMAESIKQDMPPHLVKRGVPRSTIYDLTFDYDFSRVPRDLGDTQMRIDYANEPGYWDKVVDKAAKNRKRSLHSFDGNHKRWLEDSWREDMHFSGLSREELHKRWFGSDIVDWLKGIINGIGDTDVPIVSNSYTDDFVVVLLNEVVQGCAIGPEGTTVSGKLDMRASTHVELDTNFGFTLIATLGDNLAISFQDSFLYFNNRGKVSAKFTADAVATAEFDSGDKKLLSADQFGATFSVPGVVTIGPNFQLFGAVKGKATLGAYFEANVNLADWNVRQTYPDQGSDWDPKSEGSGPDRDGTQDLLTPEWQYGVSASGFVELHVKPTITFGVTFNPTFVKTDGVNVNLVADGWIRFHADASNTGGSSGDSSSSFCYGVDAGADLYCTVNAPSFNGWSLGSSPYPIASSDPIQIIPNTCPISTRGLDGYDSWILEDTASDDVPVFNTSDYRRRVRDRQRRHDEVHGVLEERGQAWGPVIRLGISCPASDGDGTALGTCDICPETTAISRRDDDDSCILVQGNSGESTCSTGQLDARDLLFDGPNSGPNPVWNMTGLDEGHSTPTRTMFSHHDDELLKRTIEKRATKTGAWNVNPPVGPVERITFNTYPSCNTANVGSIIKWFGYDEVGTSTPQCPTAITKFTAAQVDTSQYQTDHIFEPQTVLQFFDFIRGGGQFGAGISMPTGYTAASSAWVNDVLLNYGSGTFSVQLLTGTYAGHSVLSAISDHALGSDSAAGKSLMAVLYKGTNNYKGHFFSLDTIDTLGTGLRDTKITQRNVAGVFGYMQSTWIAPKFQQSGQEIEDVLTDFDASYTWRSNPAGEPGRPAGANRGLRDLWAYWIDVYLNSIETKASAWATRAQNDVTSTYTGSTEAKNWATAFFGAGGAGNAAALKFSQPNPGSQVGRNGVAVPNSRYGMWTTASGPWS